MAPGAPFGAPDPDSAVYVISVAAELTGLHPQTLRAYERMGLITPGRTGGGGRRYSHRDLELLREIADLTAAGIGIEGVRRILDLEHQVAALRQRNAELLAELDAATREALRAGRRHRRAVPGSRRLRAAPATTSADQRSSSARSCGELPGRPRQLVEVEGSSSSGVRRAGPRSRRTPGWRARAAQHPVQLAHDAARRPSRRARAARRGRARRSRRRSPAPPAARLPAVEGDAARPARLGQSRVDAAAVVPSRLAHGLAAGLVDAEPVGGPERQQHAAQPEAVGRQSGGQGTACPSHPWPTRRRHLQEAPIGTLWSTKRRSARLPVDEVEGNRLNFWRVDTGGTTVVPSHPSSTTNHGGPSVEPVRSREVHHAQP